MKFYSQYQQDQFLWESFFSDKKNGFFVEVGADDGLRHSNSAFFEKHLDWKGICVEPRPSIFEKLCANRDCFCENVAISNEMQTEIKFLEIFGYGRQLKWSGFKYVSFGQSSQIVSKSSIY